MHEIADVLRKGCDSGRPCYITRSGTFARWGTELVLRQAAAGQRTAAVALTILDNIAITGLSLGLPKLGPVIKRR